MTTPCPFKIAKDILSLHTSKEIRDYVAINGHIIWQLPTSNLLNIQLHCLVEVVDTGGLIGLCLDRIEDCLIEAN